MSNTLKRIAALAAVCALVALVVIAHRGAVASAPPAEATRDGWPETPAGALGRRWVEAFSAGESGDARLHRCARCRRRAWPSAAWTSGSRAIARSTSASAR
jgi:hypothetical protein